MSRATVFLLMFIVLNVSFLNGQINYLMTIENCEVTGTQTLEFDVIIKSTAGSFELTSYQCAFSFNKTIRNGGNLSLTYIDNSSELSNVPQVGIGVKSDNGTDELAFASMPGSDIINTTPVKVGRFRLLNTNPFSIYASKLINLNWDFEGVVSTILTGTGFNNITSSVNHNSAVDSFTKLNIVQANGTDTTNTSLHPGKTIDGKGFFDGDPNSRWTSPSMPKWLIFDFGNQRIVNLLRFSFYRFEQNRKYIYSVQVSNDMNSWTDVVSNDTSDLIEWTDILINPISAKYVKLIFLSNNQNNTAVLWEAEIWSGDQTVPVELISFNGFLSDKSVTLNWSTASENNNMGFEIERKFFDVKSSYDLWTKIGFVEGNGTTTEIKTYSFTDHNLPEGKYAYRLKQIDYNGNYQYSETVEMEILPQLKSFQLNQNYPNPFNPQTNISFNMLVDGKVKLSVFNILGEEIINLIDGDLSAGYHEISFNGDNFSSGIYVYKLDVENHFSDVRKMILIK